MDDNSGDPVENLYRFAESYRVFMSHALHAGFRFAKLSGLREDTPRIEYDMGGFGLLELNPSDRWNPYSATSRSKRILFRHSCNIWFANDTLNASADMWVIEVFNEASELKCNQLRNSLLADGFTYIALLCRGEQPRREKVYEDYFPSLYK